MAAVLIEGGARVLAETLSEDLADELRLAIAPFFVGDPGAPRLAFPLPPPASYPRNAANPMTLTDVRRVGDVAVLRYQCGTRERHGRATG